MKNNKIKKLRLSKCTISNLEMNTVKGGVVDSCTPTCHISFPTNPTRQSNNFECENFTQRIH